MRLAISMAVLLVATSGVAWAAINCHAGKACYGDNQTNVMFGAQGRDRIYAGGGHDRISGKAGKDRLCGGRGNEGYIFRWLG